mmetsp:Transcript_78023/g.137641  ORF Transcript_78023/g.137641 Transcript_78023/m.137641 type:complete len:116 (+) Transcript_78023:1241-1588(+)
MTDCRHREEDPGLQTALAAAAATALSLLLPTYSLGQHLLPARLGPCNLPSLCPLEVVSQCACPLLEGVARLLVLLTKGSNVPLCALDTGPELESVCNPHRFRDTGRDQLGLCSKG